MICHVGLVIISIICNVISLVRKRVLEHATIAHDLQVTEMLGYVRLQLDYCQHLNCRVTLAKCSPHFNYAADVTYLIAKVELRRLPVEGAI